MGKRFEQRVDQAGKNLENWYDRTFGILGPLLASFLFLIILRLVIEIARISGDEVPEMNTITAVILIYLLPLFGTTLLTNYTSYFARKSYKFRIFSPLFHAIALVIFLWFVAEILDTLRYRLQNADLGTAAVDIENSLPTVFVFVLLIGYVILAMNMSREQEKKP
jgi:predicted Na+-dependent transporter